MNHYAGIDVSLEYSSVCVVEAGADRSREQGGERTGGADRLVWVAGLGLRASGWRPGHSRNGSTRRCARRGLGGTAGDAPCARRFQATVKTDRKDARGIAQLMRLGWFRPVHCKSGGPGGARAADRAEAGEGKLLDLEMSLRGILRGFGLKVGQSDAGSVRGPHPGTGGRASEPGGDCRSAVRRGGVGAGVPRLRERRVRLAARRAHSAADVGARRRSHRGADLRCCDRRAGALQSSKMVGAYFGLTPKKYQSGETDITGRISKIGDAAVRARSTRRPTSW